MSLLAPFTTAVVMAGVVRTSIVTTVNLTRRISAGNRALAHTVTWSLRSSSTRSPISGEDGARGCVDVLDLMWDMDVTGSFYRGDYGKGPKIMEW